MKAADMLPYEKVHIYNVSHGERFSTYLIKGKKGSGEVGIYGAAAHKAGLGDKLIIVSYVFLDEEEVDFFRPKVLILGDGNQVVEVK
jgi:aspartate 1-decarboxylase